MSSRHNSHVHATLSPSPPPPPPEQEHDPSVQITIPPLVVEHKPPQTSPVDYVARGQWLRAAVLGANDGLVSVASLMIGVGAVNQTAKAMLVSGLAGLVAGACSMAIGEFVSVYAQYDIEVAQIEREILEGGSKDKESLQSPLRAATASALAFALGAVLPLLAGGFIRPWGLRLGLVCVVSSLGLVSFGAAGAILGGARVPKSAFRVLVGGWLAMLVTYGVLRFFGLFFKMHVSSG